MNYSEHFRFRARYSRNVASLLAYEQQSRHDKLFSRVRRKLTKSRLSTTALVLRSLLVDVSVRLSSYGRIVIDCRRNRDAARMRDVPFYMEKPIPSDCSRIATGTLRCAEAVRPLRRCTKRTRSVRASPSRRSTTPWARTATRKSGPAAEPSLPITSSIRTTRHLRPTRASTVCNIFTTFSISLSFYLSLFLFLSLSLPLLQGRSGVE